MLYKNSYIFLRRENEPEIKKKPDGNTYEIRLESSFVSIFEKSFDDVVYNEKKDINFNMNSGLFKIIYQNRKRVVYFKYYDVGKNYYLDIIINSKSEYDAINILDLVNTIIMGDKNNFEKYYLSIISYDYISEYYCNKLYPYLNKFDRKMRKLLFNIYTLNFDHNYYTATTTEEFRSSIKERIGSMKIKNIPKEDCRIKYAFYSLEYNNIIDLLFTKTVTENEKKKVQDFIDDNNDLSKFSDTDIREMFETYQGKTDWERFFGDKEIEEDFKTTLNEIREYRNSIAHCKFMSKNQYSLCLDLIRKTTKSIDKALRITEKRDFIVRSMEIHEEELQSTTRMIHEALEKINKTLVENISIMMKSVNDRLTQNIGDIIKVIPNMLPDIELPKYNFKEQLEASLKEDYDEREDEEENTN